MDRDFVINRLKSKSMTIDDFNFDKLSAPPLVSLLTPTDIGDLESISRSIRYSAQPKIKLDLIDQILRRRGFYKGNSGTNRTTYKFLEDQSFLLKIAYDNTGRTDSPAEFRNQMFLRPFVTKIFEVSPGGTIALCERTQPITNREQFVAIADDVFYLIDNILLDGRFVVADIGSEYFMNYSIRPGFGVVLHDFPYVYQLDGKKLYCNKPDPMSPTGTCDGEIDYDPGFNRLICKRCGRHFRAKELAKDIQNEAITVRAKGDLKMKIKLSGGTLTQNVEIDLGNNNVRRTPSKPIAKANNNSRPKTVNGVDEMKIEPVVNKPEKMVQPPKKQFILNPGQTVIQKQPIKTQAPTEVFQQVVEDKKEEESVIDAIQEAVNEQAMVTEKEAAIEMQSESAIEAAKDNIKKYIDNAVSLSGLVDKEDLKELRKYILEAADQFKLGFDEEPEEEVKYEFNNRFEIDIENQVINVHTDLLSYTGDSERRIIAENNDVLDISAEGYWLIEKVDTTPLMDAEKSLSNLVEACKELDKKEMTRVMSNPELTELFRKGYQMNIRKTKEDEDGFNNVFSIDCVDEEGNVIEEVLATNVYVRNVIHQMPAPAVEEQPEPEEEEVVEDAEVEDDGEEEGAYSPHPVYMSAILKNIHHIFPTEPDHTVLLFENPEGNYMVTTTGDMFTVDEIDGKMLDDLEIVSKEWLKTLIQEREKENGEPVPEEIETKEIPVGVMSPTVGINGVVEG